MDKPAKRTKENGFFKSNGLYWEYDKGFNHCHMEWEEYNQDLLSGFKRIWENDKIRIGAILNSKYYSDKKDPMYLVWLACKELDAIAKKEGW